MLESTKRLGFEIKKKWSNTSKEEKNQRINTLIDEVLAANLPYDIIEDKRFEAKIIAEMILRKDGPRKN